MPIVQQDHGFDFTIKAEDKAPAKGHVTGAEKKYLVVRIGKPDLAVPHIEKYENVDQDEVIRVFDTINDYQINFLTAWDRIHGGEWKAARKGPVKIGPKVAPAAGPRLRLKPRANVEKIKELIGGIADRRVYKLQKKLLWDLDAAGFKTIGLGLYLRLGGWLHTGGTYVSAMMEVKALCKAMFRYELPVKIGRIGMKDSRYWTGFGLARICNSIAHYHNRKLTDRGSR